MQFLVALGASFKYFFSFSPLCLSEKAFPEKCLQKCFSRLTLPKVEQGERFSDVNFERSPYLIIRLLDYTAERKTHETQIGSRAHQFKVRGIVLRGERELCQRRNTEEVRVGALQHFSLF